MVKMPPLKFLWISAHVLLQLVYPAACTALSHYKQRGRPRTAADDQGDDVCITRITHTHTHIGEREFIEPYTLILINNNRRTPYILLCAEWRRRTFASDRFSPWPYNKRRARVEAAATAAEDIRCRRRRSMIILAGVTTVQSYRRFRYGADHDVLFVLWRACARVLVVRVLACAWSVRV